MNTTVENPNPPAPTGFRRVAPALALFFMSPFVAEFLLGDFAIDAFWLVLVVGPMYGGGAIVIRELTRRTRRGWPTMILLALAYGLLEEGVVIQTLFNPNYLGLHLLEHGWIPALGMGAWWTVFVLTIHMVWSISVPIAIIEGLFAERRTTPWLGNVGLVVACVLLVGGAVLVRIGTQKQGPFSASMLQVGATCAMLLVVAVVAFLMRKNAMTREGAVPNPWLVAVFTLIMGCAFFGATWAFKGWPRAGADFVVLVVGIVLIGRWSQRASWTPLHTLAAAAGPLITYAIYGFPQEPVVGSKGTIDLIGNAVFATIAVVLLVLAVKAQRKHIAPRQ